MIYYLNHNYGKVAVKNNDRERVAVYNQLGKLQHLIFCGEVDDSNIQSLDYVSAFFGCSGYRLSVDVSWTFCKGFLLAGIDSDKCYVMTASGEPIDCIEGHPFYGTVKALIARNGEQPVNNVVRIGMK